MRGISYKICSVFLLLLMSYFFAFSIPKANAQAINYTQNLDIAATEAAIKKNKPLTVTTGEIIGEVIVWIGVLFLILTIFGGFLWMTSAGDPEKAKKGAGFIKNGVIGIVIVFSSYAMVNFVFSNILLGDEDEPGVIGSCPSEAVLGCVPRFGCSVPVDGGSCPSSSYVCCAAADRCFTDYGCVPKEGCEVVSKVGACGDPAFVCCSKPVPPKSLPSPSPKTCIFDCMSKCPPEYSLRSDMSCFGGNVCCEKTCTGTAGCVPKSKCGLTASGSCQGSTEVCCEEIKCTGSAGCIDASKCSLLGIVPGYCSVGVCCDKEITCGDGIVEGSEQCEIDADCQSSGLGRKCVGCMCF